MRSFLTSTALEGHYIVTMSKKIDNNKGSSGIWSGLHPVKKSYHTSLPPFQLIYDNRIMQVFLF